jgi:hypothetical protein
MTVSGGDKRNDPLFQPDAVVSRSVEQKMSGLRDRDGQARAESKPPVTPPGVLKAAPPQMVAIHPVEGHVQPAEGMVPLGAQSVLAASNGLDRNIQYVPVPIVTVPDARRLPLPPVPEIPQAPQLNNKLYQNAFTPAVPPDAQQETPPGGAPMMGMQPMAPGYGPNMPPGGMVAAYPPWTAPTRAAAPGMAPYPPYAMPAYGMPPAGMPMQPPGRGTVPYAYQGPMPPNPFTAPRGNGQTAVAAIWPAGQPRNAAMDRPAVPAGPSAAQASANDAILEMITVLKTSTYPSQCEWAANNLSTFDGHGNPLVVQALVMAAKEDPAATVRAACAYNLGRMRVSAEPVLATLRQLRSDRDPRVRTDATQALARLNAGEQPGVSPAADHNAVQPVRATQPSGH